MTELRVVSEFFMIVLCILSGPAGENDMDREILIDVIGERGYIDTMIVKRMDESLVVYGEMNFELMEVARIQPLADRDHVYVGADVMGKKGMVDLPQLIVDFKSMDLSKAKKEVLKLKDGTEIRLNRSHDVVYLTPVEQKHTYVVHKGK